MSDGFKDTYNDFTDEQKRNYGLCVKYPILVPVNAWTGKELDDYQYEFTALDEVPTGWRIAFGEQWASEVQEAINKLPEKQRDEIYIVQLKEKYGSFRQYFSSYTDELDGIIDKYERLSERTCIQCGAPATKISQGWISPFCDVCAKELRCNTVDIDEWFKEVDEDEDN